MVLGRDWVRVVAEERCDQCGLLASGVERDELATCFGTEAELWTQLLSSSSAANLRHRKDRNRWSALELGAHVRDVLEVFCDRVSLGLVQADPEFDWWDHEDAAVVLRYNEQPPSVVGEKLAYNANRMAALLGGLDNASWLRAGTRRQTERFTIEGLARFALHESVHHRSDAEGQQAPLQSRSRR